MFHTKFAEKIKTYEYILCSITYFPKSVSFMRNVEIYGTPGQATDGSIIRLMRFAWWIPKATDTHSRVRNNYCFSTATMVTRTRLGVTFIRTLPVSFYILASTTKKKSYYPTATTKPHSKSKSISLKRQKWQAETKRNICDTLSSRVMKWTTCSKNASCIIQWKIIKLKRATHFVGDMSSGRKTATRREVCLLASIFWF